MNAFTTSAGNTIPALAMRRAAARINEDWQRVANEELREFIPESEDDLDEVMEVIREIETALQQGFA